jgi:GNAT superfamily N-acetyltransferase
MHGTIAVLRCGTAPSFGLGQVVLITQRCFVSRLKVARATDADFHQIVRDIVEFWGSDRTLRLHNVMYVHELADTSYVIKQGDRVIAYLFGLIAEGKKVAYVSLMGVRDSHKRQGLGERLYELFEEHARGGGCTKLTAVTVPSNANSVAFHTGKIGMRCTIVKDYGGPGADRAVFEKTI